MHRSAASLVCALANAYSSPCVEVQAYNLGPEKQSEVVPGQEMRLSESQALWGLGVGGCPRLPGLSVCSRSFTRNLFSRNKKKNPLRSKRSLGLAHSSYPAGLDIPLEAIPTSTGAADKVLPVSQRLPFCIGIPEAVWML